MEPNDLSDPSWLSHEEFPFAPRTFRHAEGRMHYVDEGSGPVILFVHGTPDWSFGFRHLIKTFRSSYRCVAVDHLGFGLSDKPKGADYTVAAHARRLQDFIDHHMLKDVTLVVTDFGGGIGLQHALRDTANVKGIVLYNTWMWPLDNDKRFAGPSRMMRGWLGRLLYQRFGFSVNAMMPSGYGDKRRLTPALHAHYKQVFPTPASREALHVLVKELLDATPFWDAQWSMVDRLRGTPALLCWGMKDRFFPPDLLERWSKALPHATIRRFPEAGHFVHEEAAEELSWAMRGFLTAIGAEALAHPR
ncbi:MAG TPA: alpha/beta fold hydrolase [Flavobacteriales bacterium]|nr:alpha/beta fold hydrolase [Flavobacteriales bacterium]